MTNRNIITIALICFLIGLYISTISYLQQANEVQYYNASGYIDISEPDTILKYYSSGIVKILIGGIFSIQKLYAYSSAGSGLWSSNSIGYVEIVVNDPYGWDGIDRVLLVFNDTVIYSIDRVGLGWNIYRVRDPDNWLNPVEFYFEKINDTAIELKTLFYVSDIYRVLILNTTAYDYIFDLRDSAITSIYILKKSNGLAHGVDALGGYAISYNISPILTVLIIALALYIAKRLLLAKNR